MRLDGLHELRNRARLLVREDYSTLDEDLAAIRAVTGDEVSALAHRLLARPLSVAARWDGPPRTIRKIFVDVADQDLPRYRTKLGTAADAHGPLTFLGWSRCFADAGRPSRFLIYCR